MATVARSSPPVAARRRVRAHRASRAGGALSPRPPAWQYGASWHGIPGELARPRIGPPGSTGPPRPRAGSVRRGAGAGTLVGPAGGRPRCTGCLAPACRRRWLWWSVAGAGGEAGGGARACVGGPAGGRCGQAARQGAPRRRRGGLHVGVQGDLGAALRRSGEAPGAPSRRLSDPGRQPDRLWRAAHPAPAAPTPPRCQRPSLRQAPGPVGPLHATSTREETSSCGTARCTGLGVGTLVATCPPPRSNSTRRPPARQ